MTTINPSSGVLNAMSGLRQAEQAQLVALKAVSSGSLDMDTMAQAASILQGAQGQGSASAIALVAGLRQQSMFIDMLV